MENSGSMASTTQNMVEVKDRFFSAIADGVTEEVQEILKAHPDAILWEHSLDDGRTYIPRTLPLHAAVLYWKTDIMELLLAAKADINAQAQDRTALMVASALGKTDIVKFLLKRHADPNIGDGFTTPLMEAAEFGYPAVMEVLIDGGARINDTGNHDWTALHFAAASGKKESVTLLLDHDADTEAKRDDDRTPAQWAINGLGPYIEERAAAKKLKYKQEKSVSILSASFSRGTGKTIIAPERATFGRKNAPQHKLSV